MKLGFTILFFILYCLGVKAQVVFNELMVDPNPSNQLPESEYIELMNVSSEVVDLYNYSIADPSKKVVINEHYLLQPNALVLLVSPTYRQTFNEFGENIISIKIPSLNNSSDALTLFNDENTISDKIDYELSWYQDVLKSQGGWSLERINPYNSCTQNNNWTSSQSPLGGSPAQTNSVLNSDYKDSSALELERLYHIDKRHIFIKFSKAIEITQQQQLYWIKFEPHLSIQQVNWISPMHLEIQFEEDITPGKMYTCYIEQIKDCENLSQLSTQAVFGLTKAGERGEVLLNEILFNPYSGGVDFIELINVSASLIALDDITVAELDPFDRSVVDFIRIENSEQYIKPQHFMVLTSKPQNILEQYNVLQPSNLISVNIPNYSDNEGVVALLNAQLDTLDVLHYDASWHSAVLSQLDGVSLERLSLNNPTQDKNNWASASFTSGNATPTAKNSNVYNEMTINEGLTLSHEVFTPDSNGRDDFLFISFKNAQPNSRATVIVYSLYGQPVKTLLNNQLIGATNQLRWDGLDENGHDLPVGHYIIWAHLYNTDHDNIYKKSVVISRNNSKD